MRYHTDSFEFEIPERWCAFKEGNRLVIHGLARQELIISSTSVAGTGSAQERARVLEQLFQNAVASALAAADHADLTVTRALSNEPTITSVECNILETCAESGRLLFHQAIIRSSEAVMLATFEAPVTSHANQAFYGFVKSVSAR